MFGSRRGLFAERPKPKTTFPSIPPPPIFPAMSLQSSRPGEDLVVQILKNSELKRISSLRKDRFSKEACLKELQSYRGIWEKEDRVEGEVEVKEGVMLRRCLVVEDLIEEVRVPSPKRVAALCSKNIVK